MRADAELWAFFRGYFVEVAILDITSRWEKNLFILV